MIGFEHFFTVSSALFIIGLAGLFLRPGQVIAILISIQLIVVAAVLNLVAYAHFDVKSGSQLLAFFAMLVSSLQLALGVAICVSFHRRHKTLDLRQTKVMKG